MSKKHKHKAANRPATRRYVQSMARRLKAELLKAQAAEIRAALNAPTYYTHPELARRPDGLTPEGYPFTYTATSAADTKRRVSG